MRKPTVQTGLYGNRTLSQHREILDRETLLLKELAEKNLWTREKEIAKRAEHERHENEYELRLKEYERKLKERKPKNIFFDILISPKSKKAQSKKKLSTRPKTIKDSKIF